LSSEDKPLLIITKPPDAVSNYACPGSDGCV
jgi:hypothetical protein